MPLATTPISKRCRKCDTVKLISCFSRHADTVDRFDNRCKDCVNKTRQSNRDKLREDDTNRTNFENNTMPYLDLNQPNEDDTTWQGGKEPCNIFERYKGTSKHCVIACVKDTKKNINVQKTFSCKKYGSLEKATEMAKNHIHEANHSLGLVSNQYKIIKKNGKPTYVIVRINDTYITLADYSDLDLIRKGRIQATRSGDKRSKHYARFDYQAFQIPLHKKFTGFDMTDHINGYPLDNRRINLQKTNPSKNNKNKTRVNEATIVRRVRRYICTITYTSWNRFKKITISQDFQGEKEAKKWLASKKKDIDNHIQFGDREVLSKEFEEIMEKYGDGFKWHDNFTKTNDKTEIDNAPVSPQKEQTGSGAKSITSSSESKKYMTDKEKTYHKYLTVNPDYDLTKVKMAGRAIQHIVDNEKSYKFCSACDEWKLTSCYPSSVKNWDKFDRRCKICKNSPAKNAATKAWKEANKEKTSAYNKQYREKNAEKVAQLNKEWYQKNGEEVKEKRKEERRVAKEEMIEKTQRKRKPSRVELRKQKEAKAKELIVVTDSDPDEN